MAARKKKTEKETAAALTVSTAAFKHGASAYGARCVKKGFGFSEQEDLEWALGWPHVKRLVEGHPDDKDPVANWVKTPRYRMDFPREIASCFVRFFKFAPSTGDEVNQWMARAKEHLETRGPITESEAREIVRLQLANDKNAWWLDNFPEALMLMEAFVGPGPVAEALVESLEAVSPDVLLKQSNSNRCQCVSFLGILLLRTPDALSVTLQERTRRVFDDAARSLPGGLIVRDAEGEQDSLPYRTLDLMLNGKEGVLRSGTNAAKDQIYPRDLLFVQDDAAFVLERLRKAAKNDPWEPLARLVFLGGDGVLDLEAEWWPKYVEPDKDTAQKSFVLQYGRIRHEKILPIFLAMSQTSKARKEATAWFTAHADYTRPYLERTGAGSGDAAAWAKAIAG
jgi:hypothetical protein